MQVKRFFAADMRQAMKLVRDELGADAAIIGNRRIAGGVELTAALDYTPQALAPRVLMVNEGMQAQATGAEQINHALVQLGDASSQTVESLRQASFAIDELSQVAVGLRSGVSRFKV